MSGFRVPTVVEWPATPERVTKRPSKSEKPESLDRADAARKALEVWVPPSGRGRLVAEVDGALLAAATACASKRRVSLGSLVEGALRASLETASP